VDVAPGGDVAGGGCVVAGDCWPACIEPPQPATRTANTADPTAGATCLCTPALSPHDRGNAMVEDFPIPDLAISLGFGDVTQAGGLKGHLRSNDNPEPSAVTVDCQASLDRMSDVDTSLTTQISCDLPVGMKPLLSVKGSDPMATSG
jgi:hypothetical protein